LLIIFFMVAARFGDMQRSVDLQLPKVAQGGASNAPPEPLEVQVRSDGQVELQAKIVSLPVLIDTLRGKMAASTETEVLISGDARCDFQHVAATLAACREAGVTKVGVTVEIAQAVSSIK
jgi:biopolymer transport protein ExbD